MLSFTRQIADADALLLTEAEYGSSEVLENLFHWVKLVDSQPFAGKPAAILETGGPSDELHSTLTALRSTVKRIRCDGAKP